MYGSRFAYPYHLHIIVGLYDCFVNDMSCMSRCSSVAAALGKLIVVSYNVNLVNGRSFSDGALFSVGVSTSAVCCYIGVLL